MTAPMLIGLAGAARVGKDTVGARLTEQHGFERRAFADPLRELAWQLWPEYAAYVERYGYEAAKRQWPTRLREDLVRLGAGARAVLGVDVWLDACLPQCSGQVGFAARTWHGPSTVVTDCRYPNEAQRIIDLGGAVWFITRPGVEPANSEEARSLMDVRRLPHLEVPNNGTVERLHELVDTIIGWSR